jgi:hypothetical protein
MGARVIEVWPNEMLEEVGPRLPPQGVPEQVYRPTIKTLLALDHREHFAPRQHRTVRPTRTWLVKLLTVLKLQIVV